MVGRYPVTVKFWRGHVLGKVDNIIGPVADFDGYDGLRFETPGMSTLTDVPGVEQDAIRAASEVIRAYFRAHPEPPQE